MPSSLEETDAASAAHAVAPRVSLADINAAISAEYFTTGDMATEPMQPQDVEPLHLLTLCLIVMRNGFVFVGKSAPASPENFNRELGRKFAREDAIRQIWPMMGFALRDRLAAK